MRANKVEAIYADEKFERIRFYFQECGINTLEDLSTFNFNDLMFVPDVSENDIAAAMEVFINENLDAPYNQNPPHIYNEDEAITKTVESRAGEQDCISSHEIIINEIRGLPLSRRAKNCLSRSGIFSLKRLKVLSEDDLMSIQSMGRKTCDEIMAFIKSPQSQKISQAMVSEDYCTFENMDIASLPLSVRAINCLKREGMLSSHELLFLNEDDLMSIRNMGRKTCDEILDFIKSISPQQANSGLQCQIEGIHEFNKRIPILLLSSIGVSQDAISFLSDSGFKAIDDLYGRNLRPREYTIMRPVVEYLKTSVVDHFVAEMYSLKDQWRTCIIGRGKGATLQEVGEEIGVTRERVRQIVEKVSRLLRGSADLIAGALFQAQNNIFAFSDLVKLFNNEEISLCYKLVQQESSYAIYFKYSDKFVCSSIYPSDAQQTFTDFAYEIVGEGFNFSENLELIESELHKRSLDFLDFEDVMNFLIHEGYHFYGDYVAKSKQGYAKICIDAVKTYFHFDIKLDSNKDNEDMKRLRQIIDRHYQGIPLPPDNRTVTTAMTRDATKMLLSGRGRYCPAEKVVYCVELLNEVRDFVNSSPQTSFYYGELYSHFEGRFLAETNIHNAHFLHGMLKCLFPDDYVYERDLFVKSGSVRQDVGDRLETILKKQGGAMTKAEIRKAIPGINDFVFTFAAMRLPEVIQWDHNELNHIHNLDLTSEDLALLGNLIKHQTYTHQGYCSDALLYAVAKEHCQDLFQRNRIQNARNLYYIASYYFGGNYRFRRPHIITNDFPIKDLSVVNIARVLLNNEYRLNYEEYITMANNLGWAGGTLHSVFSELQKDYVRISGNDYINKEHFNIPDSTIEVLNGLLFGFLASTGYYAIVSIFDYEDFPKCEYSWNEFLIESIITECNTDYRTISPQVNGRRHQRGIIVPQDSPYHSLEDLVVDVLKRNNIYSISESGLERFLRVNGIITTVFPQELFECPKMVYKNENFTIKRE
ncbi:MAG: hypothetical protein FWH32_03270 [Clostridiales bacterium]|nr:hypothetical protein [Clostridiales bacterium]